MDRDRRTATAPRSTQVETRAGGDLFIVDNSDEDWKALQYLREWAQISTAFDIATGFLEIGALLALDGEWQKLDKIRILMGAETTKRTRQALLEALRTAATEQLDESIEKVKEQNDFLKAFLSALAGKTGLGFVESGASDKGFGAEDAFHYIYAIYTRSCGPLGTASVTKAS